MGSNSPRDDDRRITPLCFKTEISAAKFPHEGCKARRIIEIILMYESECRG